MSLCGTVASLLSQVQAPVLSSVLVQQHSLVFNTSHINNLPPGSWGRRAPLWVATLWAQAKPLIVTTQYIYMECVHIFIYIFTPPRKKIELSSRPLPPTACVSQPDSWFSIDAAGRRGVPAAVQPGRQEAAGFRRAGKGLRQTHHAWGAPHLNGWVIAGGQQQLLVRRAERHRVHHIVVSQTGQTDVVVTVPDVAVLVFCSTAGRGAECYVSKALPILTMLKEH